MAEPEVILNRHMKELNISAEQLSKDTGVKLVRIKRYLQGDCDKMPMNEVQTFCEYFKIPTDYFMGMSETKQWSFRFGNNEDFKSSFNNYDKSCIEFVEYLKDKELLKVVEIKYE